MHRIHIAAQHPRFRRDIIGDNPIAPFARQLVPGIGFKVFGLRRKADHQCRSAGACFGQAGENVWVFDQLQAGCAGMRFLHFLRGHIDRPPVGNRCCHDGGINRQMVFARRQHFHRRFNPRDVYAFRVVKLCRPAHEMRLSPCRRQSRGNGITLLAR